MHTAPMSETTRSLNAAAPAPLRLLLDGIERLGRLDGWIGAACLITLTLLMLAEITVRALSNFIPVGAGRHPGGVGVFVVPHGRVLHVRRRHDAARGRTHPRHAGARAA